MNRRLLMSMRWLTGLVLAAVVVESGLRAQTESERWRDDVRFLATELPRLHRNLFDVLPRAEFDAAIRRLDERIPSLATAEITVELARIIGMIEDGHTRLVEVSGPAMLGWHRYPVRFALFADGLFVEAADRAHASIVGRRVVRLGSMSADDAVKAVVPFVPRDNAMTARSRVPGYLAIPEILRGAGVAAGASTIPLVVEAAAGETTDVMLQAIEWSDPIDWVPVRDPARPPAGLSFKNPGNRYWFEYVPGPRLMYVQFNAVADKPDEPLDAFWDRVFAAVEREPVDRFVLDLRANGGGDNTFNRPLVHHLIRAASINRRGRLFVLIGRRTFSAATALVVDLEKHTEAIFVGEPTGGHPNHYTDASRIVLPNSGLRIAYSPLFWAYSFPGDRRVWVAPEIAVEQTSADYFEGRDPVLDAALGDVAIRSLADLMTDAYVEGGLASATDVLRAWRDDPKRKYFDVEWDVHLFGRRLMARKQPADAVRVFEENRAAHPGSYRVYEDLGHALEGAGRKDDAIAQFKRSLEINPSNLDAIDAIERLTRDR